MKEEPIRYCKKCRAYHRGRCEEVPRRIVGVDNGEGGITIFPEPEEPECSKKD